MKAPHKFSLALRIIAWIITVWMAATTAILGIGGVYELRPGGEGGMFLVLAVIFLAITAVFAWLATARNAS